MKNILTAFLMLLTVIAAGAQYVYSTDHAVISFFSSAPLEDIKATSNAGSAAIDAQTGSVYVKVQIRSFRFRKSLMQEHFNEKYMESDKYPYAEFKGKIVEDIGPLKDGEYAVTVRGNLDIHNVIKEYTVKVALKLTGEKMLASSTFNIRLADHKIRIPTIVTRNIAEIIEVSISGILIARVGQKPEKSHE
ncbi:MAG TPA: YceI family protein [Flavitalea sp.]|nr:YceI family protein [Flavitalea sp.]